MKMLVDGSVRSWTSGYFRILLECQGAIEEARVLGLTGMLLRTPRTPEITILLFGLRLSTIRHRLLRTVFSRIGCRDVICRARLLLAALLVIINIKSRFVICDIVIAGTSSVEEAP